MPDPSLDSSKTIWLQQKQINFALTLSSTSGEIHIIYHT